MAGSTSTPKADPKAAPRKRSEREYLIRQRVDARGIWKDVGTVTAKSGAHALEVYAANEGDNFEGGPHEAVSARYRHEGTATKHVQTTIKWA